MPLFYSSLLVHVPHTASGVARTSNIYIGSNHLVRVAKSLAKRKSLTSQTTRFKGCCGVLFLPGHPTDIPITAPVLTESIGICVVPEPARHNSLWSSYIEETLALSRDTTLLTRSAVFFWVCIVYVRPVRSNTTKRKQQRDWKSLGFERRHPVALLKGIMIFCTATTRLDLGW